jgi:SAM-dependent methyltransferase
MDDAEAGAVQVELVHDLVARGLRYGDEGVGVAGCSGDDLTHAERRHAAERALPEEGHVVESDHVRRSGRADRSDARQRVDQVRADSPRKSWEQHLLAELTAAALALLARERADSRPRAPAVVPEHPRAGVRGGHGDADTGVRLLERRRQAAQVGLRSTGAAGVQEQRIQQEMRHEDDATVTRRMGYVDWHEEPGYWRDVTRHFPKDARLLDVGCGGAWIGDHFDDYTGIDVSPEAVEAARSRGRQVLLVDGDEPLPFDEESFDGVVLKDVLEHVANPVTLVREVRRVLRPGGRVFASSPDAQRWVWDDYTHRRPFTRKSFRKLFEDQGLRVEQLGYESVMPGSGIISGWTKRNRRPRLLAALARLPMVRRNVWLVATRHRSP